jgi:hypothetical protein
VNAMVLPIINFPRYFNKRISVKKIVHEIILIGRGIKLSSIIAIKGKPSLLNTKATIKERLVPYHPDVIKINVKPVKIKVLSWFLKYLERTIIPNTRERLTTETPKIPFRKSNGVRLIKI